MQERDNVLKVVGLKKHFGASQILKNITLTIKRGEVAFVIGPSGGGKSTLLRCLNFLERPNGGMVEFFGDWLCRERAAGFEIRPEKELRKVRSRMPMVFQQFNLFDHRTVLENVIEGPLVVRREARREAIENAESILRKVGLIDKRHAYPAQLSGGQKQRVGIARALAIDPKVLLMDEPFGALDAQTREVMQAELLELQARTKKTILFVTHDLDEAVLIADRIVVMRAGSVQETMTVPLKRPRGDLGAVRGTAEFADARYRVWKALHETVH